MAIINRISEPSKDYAYLNIFPDQLITEKAKENKTWIKSTMDYFANKSYAEYVKNRDGFAKNYNLVKGILDASDFYQQPEVKSFTEILMKDMSLPEYVKHYSIVSTPLNELIGELTKRPDDYKVKAFDDDSKSEELQFKTDLLNEFIVSTAKAKILEQVEGQEVSDEEIEQLTLEQVKDEIDNYTSIAEKWANHTLTCQKADFNIKEMSEDSFRDLCIAAREYFHIYEDNSAVGFNIEVSNPKTTWYLSTPDTKFISDPSGRARGAYAAGTVRVMEISEIIEAIPEITKEEIDHLRTSLQDYGLINVRESNLGNNTSPGIDSIKYDTYDPLIMQEKMMIESEMKENNDELKDFLGLSSNVSTFGYKYVVVRAYWLSKKKIGKLTFEDEFENINTEIVDENYKSGSHPGEIDLEWGWVNQWYQGVKIGPDIYHIKPFKLFDYCPIIGINFELKNTEARSIVDMMKPFQVLYNVCMNQLYRLLEKEIGNVGRVSLRRIPRVKDGDAQDDVDIWEEEARERGIMFDDDSPENTKGAVTNQTVAGNVDLTRSSEIQSRYNLAVALKNECWELVGMSKQRLGSISASESATGTRTALQQSYAQTEPLYVAHEYVLRQVYQAILDASQYTESKKPLSTLSYINSQGTSAFIQVNGTDLKLRDLKVFPTNRPEDKRLFEELRQLAQPLLQNGGSFHDVVELYATDSIRQMKKVFKTLQDKQDEFKEESQNIEREQVEAQKEFNQAQLEMQRYEKEVEREHDAYQKEMDRINKKEIAIISALGYGQVEGEDKNNNSVPDLYEMDRINLERSKLQQSYEAKKMDIQNKFQMNKEKMSLEREKLQVTRENMKNDIQVAKINASNRAQKSKSKTKKK